MAHVFEAAPIYISRFYSGLITRRSVLTTPIKVLGRRLIELFDALWNGSSNMELGPLAKLQRRPGFLTFNSNTLTGIPQNFYSFKQTGTATPFPIIDTTTNVYYTQSGSVAPTSLITKTQATQSTFKGIGPYLYMGNTYFNKKWDGTTVTQWGISPSTLNTNLLAGAGANSAGGTAWTNPNNISSITNYATVALNNSSSSALQATTFSFNVGTATITGIGVAVDAFVSSGSATLTVQLLKNGNAVGSTQSITITNTSIQNFGFGFSIFPPSVALDISTYLWNSNWTYNDINQTTFGFIITATSSGTPTVSVRNGVTFVFQAVAPTVALVGGSLTAVTGFQYVTCYGNSNSGDVSSPSDVSALVKPAGQGVHVTLTASTDAQVNQIRVFRTTDGGPLNQLFELPTSPYSNANVIVTDNATDGQLQLVQAPQALVNNPPPLGLTNMEWYAGRLWGSVGNLLYFSTGPDATIGNPQECWAPGYVFVLPTAIVKLVAIPSGMLVWTLDAVHIVQGTSTPSFTVNYFLQDIGARTYNAIDTDGSMIYAFTSDRHLLTINASGTGEPGYNVGDILDTLDPTLVYLSCHRSGSLDQKLFISDGSTNLYSYDMSFQAWNPKAQPTGGVNAIGSIEITPGVYKFLLGATTGGQVVLQRDLATFQDNGSNYSCTAVLGSFQLADPGMLAALEAIAIEYANVGSDPTVGILAGEISGTFTTVANPVNEPPEFATPNQSFNAKRWDIRQAPINQNMRHFQLQIQFPAENAKNEIFGIGMWGPLPTSNVQPVKMPAIQGR